eukprot:gene5061-5165_t
MGYASLRATDTARWDGLVTPIAGEADMRLGALMRCVLAACAAGYVPGPGVRTFGNGSKGIWIKDGTVLLDHNVSSGCSYAYLSHFWITYDVDGIEEDVSAMEGTVFEVLLDGQAAPTVSFNAAYAAGRPLPLRTRPAAHCASSDYFPGPGSWPGDPGKGDRTPYSAGGKMGKGSLQGAWYHHHKIPFSTSAVVRARFTNRTLKPYVVWAQVRGVECVPIVLHGGLELPASARMSLTSVDQPLIKGAPAVLATVPAGMDALVYMVPWSGVAAKASGYIEGQFHALTPGTLDHAVTLGT